MECRLFADEMIEWRYHLLRRMSPLLAARNGHGGAVTACLLSVAKRKTSTRDEYFAF